MNAKLHLLQQLSAPDFDATCKAMRLDLELDIDGLAGNPARLQQRLGDLYENCVAKDSGLPYNQLVMLAQLFGLQLDVVDQVTVHSCGIGTKLLALI